MTRHAGAEGPQLVQALMGHGLSGKAIGQAIGRNDSLISQVRRGVKPGHNLVPALRTLLGEVEARTEAGAGLDRQELAAAVPAPARRMSKRGTAARVRQRVMVTNADKRPDGVPTFGTGDASRQAVRNGSRLLGQDVRHMATEAGHTKVYVTAVFTRDVSINSYGGNRKDHRAEHWAHEVEIGRGGNGIPMDELISAMDSQGDLSRAVAQLLIQDGRISGVSTPDDAVAKMTHLQVRTV